jgi:hypothetical protein
MQKEDKRALRRSSTSRTGRVRKEKMHKRTTAFALCATLVSIGRPVTFQTGRSGCAEKKYLSSRTKLVQRSDDDDGA